MQAGARTRSVCPVVSACLKPAAVVLWDMLPTLELLWHLEAFSHLG